jgi:hypothetical protein
MTRRGPRWLARGLPFALGLLLGGCALPPFLREPVPPGRVTLSSNEVVVPARLAGNLLWVEASWEGAGPFRFLVDTGSSVTLVTPALAKRFPGRVLPAGPNPRLRVRGAEGGAIDLPRASLRRLELGGAAFEEIEVLLYDCAPLSTHLGQPVDGVLGFPLFRELLLTLDYPGRRLILRPRALEALIPGLPVPADAARRTPLVTVGLGERSLLVLVDSGSAAGFSLNPAGISPRYVVPPREGALLGTLAGDRPQRVARLAESLRLGDQFIPEPVVDLTDELSSLGGGVLRQFVVTFDPGRDRVFFHRPGDGPPARMQVRSSGLSFTRTPAYWRVAAVISGSPAAAAGIVPGELVVRINGEPVSRWELARFERLVEGLEPMTMTFLEGTTEVEARITPFNLLP